VRAPARETAPEIKGRGRRTRSSGGRSTPIERILREVSVLGQNGHNRLTDIASAARVGEVVGLTEIATGTVLNPSGKADPLPRPERPQPVFGLAIATEKHGGAGGPGRRAQGGETRRCNEEWLRTNLPMLADCNAPQAAMTAP
jgi:hypothetical protein